MCASVAQRLERNIGNVEVPCSNHGRGLLLQLLIDMREIKFCYGKWHFEMPVSEGFGVDFSEEADMFVIYVN